MRNDPDPIDALIDSAARQMVAGEPSSSLRGAVRDRVQHRPSAWLASPAMAGVAAAVVIAAALVGRTLSGPAEMPGAPDNARPTIELTIAPDVTEKVRRTIDPDEVGIRSVPLQADQNRVRRARRLADEVAAPPQEEESLIPPIAIDPLEPAQIAVGSPITVESSGVMPIEVAPLQLEPLRGIE